MQKLDSKAIWIFFGRYLLIGIIFGFIPVIYGIAMLERFFIINIEYIPGLLVVFVIAIALFAYIWARLAVHYYRYEFTDIAFKKEFGVIYKMYVSIPYERIQNVDIVRGIVARLLGLSNLVIQTAGISGSVRAEGFLPGLSKEIAEQHREDLVRKIKSKNQGL